MKHANDYFRRDANIEIPPGLLIAEFANSQDALHFCRAKGRDYTVTAGINLPFAVRKKERCHESR